MLRKLLLAIALVLPYASNAAEPPPDILKTDLMVVVAHPDDEGMVAGVMARYAQGEDKVVSCVYATRGEGGCQTQGLSMAHLVPIW